MMDKRYEILPRLRKNTAAFAGMIKEKRRRAAAAVLAGMLCTVLAFGPRSSGPLGEKRCEAAGALTAWWGVMYPEFCFARPSGEAERPPKEKDGSVRFGFWFVEALKKVFGEG